MKTCPNCRENAPDNASVCPRCGQSIQPRSTFGLASRIIVAILVSFICLGLGGFGACMVMIGIGGIGNKSDVSSWVMWGGLMVVGALLICGLTMWALFWNKKKP